MEEYRLVQISAFIEKYRKVIPTDLFIMLQGEILSGKHQTKIPQSKIDCFDKLLSEHNEKERKLKMCSYHNNKGTEFEKAGKLNMAITHYEKNIDGDCYPACHAFDRLMIIYRKQKEYDNEIRVIERAIDVLCPRYPDLRVKYQERLSKAKELQLKAR